MANARDSIFLVPGFGGFGVFADPEPPSPTTAGEVSRLPRGQGGPKPLAYFERAAGVLGRETEVLPEEIYYLEPPPTGSLGARVGYLWARVVEWALRTPDTTKKLHLVGHSTGGVDVRLLMNAAFLPEWPHATRPRREDWIAVTKRVGGVVALSAPMWGAPIVHLIPGMSRAPTILLSLLAVAGVQRVHVPGTSIALQVVSELLSRGEPNDRAIGDFLVGLSTDMKEQVGRFLGAIARDHELLDDLDPDAMVQLNRRILPGDVTGRVKIVCSVAPEPSMRSSLGHGWEGGLYALLQGRAKRDLKRGPLGLPWVGTASPVPPRADANDGIVPLSSQTIDGQADAVVFGDHLDVVGHYAGGRFGGVTLLDSGARFDDPRFDALWARIAALL